MDEASRSIHSSLSASVFLPAYGETTLPFDRSQHSVNSTPLVTTRQYGIKDQDAIDISIVTDIMTMICLTEWPSNKYTLLKDLLGLELVIYSGGAQYLVSERVSNAYGAGTTFKDALMDFTSMFEEMLGHLTEEEDKLSYSLLRKLRHMHSIIKPN